MKSITTITIIDEGKGKVGVKMSFEEVRPRTTTEDCTGPHITQDDAERILGVVVKTVEMNMKH